VTASGGVSRAGPGGGAGRGAATIAFAVPVVRMPSAESVGGWLRGLPRAVRPLVVGTDSGGEVDLDQVDLRGPALLLVGNEATGMRRRARELCDMVARVPMRGSADSLNAASAASIALYEADRQRRRPAQRRPEDAG
jgi:23S rRNA (uridine2479-2'-O)-methyltransferase